MKYRPQAIFSTRIHQWEAGKAEYLAKETGKVEIIGIEIGKFDNHNFESVKTLNGETVSLESCRKESDMKAVKTITLKTLNSETNLFQDPYI